MHVHAIAFVALLSVALMPRPSTACSCAPPPDAPAALEQAGAVFVGVPVARAEDGPLVAWTFNVGRVLKGQGAEQIVVYSHSMGSACGRTFTEGTPYLIYADANSEGRLTDNTCSRTRTLDRGGADMVALGADQPDAPPAEGSTADSGEEALGGAEGGEAVGTGGPPASGASDDESGDTAEAPGAAAEADAPADDVTSSADCSVAGRSSGGPFWLALILLGGLLRRRGQAD